MLPESQTQYFIYSVSSSPSLSVTLLLSNTYSTPSLYFKVFFSFFLKLKFIRGARETSSVLLEYIYFNLAILMSCNTFLSLPTSNISSHRTVCNLWEIQNNLTKISCSKSAIFRSLQKIINNIRGFVSPSPKFVYARKRCGLIHSQKCKLVLPFPPIWTFLSLKIHLTINYKWKGASTQLSHNLLPFPLYLCFCTAVFSKAVTICVLHVSSTTFRYASQNSVYLPNSVNNKS